LCTQWGLSHSTNRATQYTFPVAFTAAPVVVAGALTSYGTGNSGSQSNPCYRAITTTGFVFCHLDMGNGFAGSTYIAIGK